MSSRESPFQGQLLKITDKRCHFSAKPCSNPDMGGNHRLQVCLHHQNDNTALASSLLPLFSTLPLTFLHDLMLLLAANNTIISVFNMGRRGLPKGVPYL